MSWNNIRPAQFEPIPVPNQESGDGTEFGSPINRDPVFVEDLPRLSRSKEVVAGAEEQIVFFVRVNIS